MCNKKEKGKKFNFNLEDMIANGINEKKEITYRSLSRYLSIPEEEKQELIQSAIDETSRVVPLSARNRRKRKTKRLV